MTPSLRNAIAIAAGLCLAAAAATGCADKDAASASAEGSGPGEVPRNVRVLEVEPTDLTEYLDLAGTLRPLRGTDISTEESGVVAAIPHDKGQVVGDGGVVILLDRRILKAEMEAAGANWELHKFNQEKTKELYDSLSVSGQEMLSVHAMQEQAKAQAEVARLRYRRAAIGAPFAGIVSDRYVELGQLVQPGTAVARVVDPFTLKLAGSITEREVRWITAGAPVEVAIEGVDATVPGAVRWVGFEADPRTGKFQVEIQVDNADLRIHPGVLARARIEKATRQGVVAIPRDAVLQKSGQQVVFVEEGGRARERAVRLGSDQGLMVAALEGVEPGDRLIVRGQRDLVDGQEVRVQEEATSPDGSTPSDPDEVRQDASLGRIDSGRPAPVE